MHKIRCCVIVSKRQIPGIVVCRAVLDSEHGVMLYSPMFVRGRLHAYLLGEAGTRLRSFVARTVWNTRAKGAMTAPCREPCQGPGDIPINDQVTATATQPPWRPPRTFAQAHKLNNTQRTRTVHGQ